MSIATDLLQKAASLGLAGTGKAIKYVIGSPVASRIAAGALISSGLSEAAKELTGPQAERRGTSQLIKAGGKIAMGGVLAVFNDPKWYDNTGAMKYSTSLQYNYRRSLRPSYSEQPDIHNVVYYLDQVVPRDMALSMDKDISAIYKTVMAANNRIGLYDASYLRAYFTNVRNVVMEYTRLVRVYGLFNAINSMDSTIPLSLLGALGLTDAQYTNAIANLAGLRMAIMQLARNISANYPMMGDYLNRTTWLYSNIYLDDDNTKAIPILFECGKYTYARYNGTTNKFEYASRNSIAIADLVDPAAVITQFSNTVFGDIATIPNEEIMVADILKAYGSKAFATLDIPGESYVPGFIYNEEVLTIIENICSAHYGYVDKDTGYSYTFNPNGSSSTVALPMYTPTTVIRTLNGSPVAQNNLTNAPGISSPTDTTQKIIGREIVNSPMPETPLGIQISMTRLNNCMDYELRVIQMRDTAISNNAYNINAKLQFTAYRTHVQTNSGDDVYAVKITTSNVPSPTSITISQLTFSEFMLFQHFPIRKKDPNLALDANTQEVYFLENAQGELIRMWGTVDWMPRLSLVYVDYNVVPTSNVVQCTFYYYELFDEKVYAPYPQSAKLTFDSIAVDSLYFADVLLKEISTENVTQKINGNKGGSNKNGSNGKGSSKKSSNRKKKQKKGSKDRNVEPKDETNGNQKV